MTKSVIYTHIKILIPRQNINIPLSGWSGVKRNPSSRESANSKYNGVQSLKSETITSYFTITFYFVVYFFSLYFFYYILSNFYYFLCFWSHVHKFQIPWYVFEKRGVFNSVVNSASVTRSMKVFDVDCRYFQFEEVIERRKYVKNLQTHVFFLVTLTSRLNILDCDIRVITSYRCFQINAEPSARYFSQLSHQSHFLDTARCLMIGHFALAPLTNDRPFKPLSLNHKHWNSDTEWMIAV